MVTDGWPPPTISTERREPFQSISSCYSPSSSLPLLHHTPMAPIRRFSAEEKGKAPREGLVPLPPKKRLVSCRGEGGAWQEVSRPWFERPPPGFPLPLYARIEGPEGVGAERRRQRRHLRWRITAVRIVPPGVHAEGSSCELVLHAAMPPRSWIRLPPSFSFEILMRGPIELWL